MASPTPTLPPFHDDTYTALLWSPNTRKKRDVHLYTRLGKRHARKEKNIDSLRNANKSVGVELPHHRSCAPPHLGTIQLSVVEKHNDHELQASADW